MMHSKRIQSESSSTHVSRFADRWHFGNLKFALAVVSIIFLIAGFAYYYSHIFVVHSILDGDTFVVLHKGQLRRVQLAGADAPEIHKNEPYAQEAKAFLQRELLGERIWLEFLDTGHHLDYKKRMLCWAWIDGSNVSYTLVAKGYAKFSGAAEADARTILTMLQQDARENFRGLWSVDSVPVVPQGEDETAEELDKSFLFPPGSVPRRNDLH